MNIFEKIKAFWAVKDFAEEIRKEAVMGNASTKPWYTRTEFWGKVAVQVITLWGAVKGFVPANYALIITTILEAVYAICRTAAKAVTDIQATKLTVASMPVAVVTPAA